MRTLSALILLLLSATTTCFAAPKIVVSIAPIHSLTSSLTRGVSVPQLLLQKSGSPHGASLRPSQARAMAEADLLIWVGPELESFLTQPVVRLVKTQVELQLLQQQSLDRLGQRHGGFWEEDEHEEESAHADQNFNPHVWLSPANAGEIARIISKRLITIDPQNGKIYQKNLEELLLRIEQTETRLSQLLRPIQDKPYLVFHDAYPYYEKAFSLNAIGSIRVSAERAPGARRLQQIRSKVTQTAAVCLFSEPQFSPALTKTLASGTALKLGVLDPLGNNNARPEDGWFLLMDDLANNLRSCLAD